jgi:hypothetical protein
MPFSFCEAAAGTKAAPETLLEPASKFSGAERPDVGAMIAEGEGATTDGIFACIGPLCAAGTSGSGSVMLISCSVAAAAVVAAAAAAADEDEDEEDDDEGAAPELPASAGPT